MAFFQLVLKANKLEKLRQSYEDEKLTSIEISKGIVKPVYTLKQQIRRRKIWFKKKVTHLLDKIFAILRDSWIHKKIVVIRTDGTLENYIAKSFAGFVGGIFLTYIFFIFFVFQLHFKLSSATFLCTIIGIILTLGLAFSFQVRCVVFLLLPQFFSKRGRQALMAYAFILALTGPVKNTMHNTGVLSESLACAQEQLKEAVKTVIDLAKQPFYALREAISKVIKTIKVVVKKIKQTLIAIKRVVLSILRVITAVFEWLGSIISICNKKLGTPFDRCQSVFEGAVADCKAKLGPIFGLVCNITYVVSSLCYIVKPLDFICMLVSYIADSVVGVVKSKIKKFTMHMKAMFYVKVKFSHSFHFETNQSRTIQDVSTSITTEIRSRTDKLFGLFDFMNFITSFFMFFIILRVLRYRYKWLTSERFDNRYITDDLRTIDLIRTRQDKETVLPLNRRERNKYVPLSSVILIKSERTKLSKSIIFLSLATVKLITYMLIDYCLYWVLNTIQLYGRFQSKVERPNVVTIHVSGDGYLADLYKSIVKAFTPHGQGTEIDTMLCLPDPVTPDFDKYTQILVLIFLCWLMAFFEPYGLRMRQVVMCQYYPERAKQRAAWLYNYIIRYPISPYPRSRGNFLKFARRQLRRKFGLTEGEKMEKVTLKEKLWATFPLLNIFFPSKQKACLLCGTVERDEDPHVKCPTPGCIGLYCTQCFTDLQNLCTICRSPMDYGDLSDMSEEKDSSEDQFEIPRRALLKPELKLEKEEDKIKDEEGKMMGEEYEAMSGEEYETEEEEMLDKEYGAEDEEMSGEEYEVEDEETMGEEYETEDEEMLGKEYGDEKILDTEYEGEEILGEKYENGRVIGGEEEGEERAMKMIAKKEGKEGRKEILGEKYENGRVIGGEEEGEERAMKMIAKKEGKIEDKEEAKVKNEKEENKLRAEQAEKMERDVGEQTDDKSLEDLDQSTEYSYTYQDESPEEVEIEKTRKRFKDVEAQKIRDDVTIQIFNQPFVKESISGSESPTSGFVVRARRKVRAKLKKRPVAEVRDSDSSSSIADTESWPSEDVDEEEVIHIEIDSDSEELLPKDRRKLGRINRIVDAVARIPWLGKGENDEKTRKGLQRKRPSLMNKIVSMLHRKQSMPIRSYKKVRRTKDSSPSSSSSSDEENESLLKVQDRDTDSPSHLARRRSRKTTTEDTSDETLTRRLSYEKNFQTKPLPRHLESAVKDTSYFEIDETKDSRIRKCVRQVEDINKPSGIKVPTGLKYRDTWSTTENDELDLCSCTSEITFETDGADKDIYSLGMSTISEQTNRVSQTVSKGKTNYTKVTEPWIKQKYTKDDFSEYKDSKDLEQENTELEENRKIKSTTTKKIKDRIEPSEEIATICSDTDNTSLYDPTADLKLYGVGHKSRNRQATMEEAAGSKMQYSEVKPTISEGKLLEIDTGNKNTFFDKLIRKTKFDKTTDLSDKNKSIQTKLHKHDRRDNHIEKDTNIADARKFGELSRELNKESRRQKEKHRRRSKRRKDSGSEKSTLTDDEEIYPELKSRTKRSRRFVPETAEKGSEAEELKPHENDYFARESPSRSYGPDICKNCASDHPEMAKRKFEMPMVKRYLPMYQSPGLIEELKRHDRMRLIQEREIRRRRSGSSHGSSDAEDRKVDRSPVPDSLFKPKEKDGRLAYQESQAYKNVLREFQTRAGRQEVRKKPRNRIPLICLSEKADKSKEVEQLYPCERQARQKPNVMKKFAHKMVAPFKPPKYKKHKCKTHRGDVKFEEMEIMYDCLCDAQVLSDASSTCSCVKKTHKSGILSSADETSDNNKSIQ